MSPPEVLAHAAALAGLPLLTPHRLRAMLRRFPPGEAWERLAAGDRALAPAGPPRRGAATPEDVLAAWSAHARRTDVGRLWDRCCAVGVDVHVLGHPTYPTVLADDLDPPAVLFSLGDLALVDGLRATVVGTRNCTTAGREMAMLVGAGLARAGVAVVSGLARGIDGASHRGALGEGTAAPIAVVASGLDVVYPPEHRDLWRQVGECGLLLSEVPPGSSPLAHRFPLRNRVLAALGEVLVVVESRDQGGSMHTVREAQERGITILAVPGSPRNRAAAGTNRLIVDGATPVLDATVVLVAMGFQRPRRLPVVDPRPTPAAEDEAVLALFADGALDLDAVVRQAGRSVGAAALALGRLEGAGWLRQSGGWFERVTVPPVPW